MFHRMTATRQEAAPTTEVPAPVEAPHSLVRRAAASAIALELCITAVFCLSPIALRTLLLTEHSLRWSAVDAHGYLSDLTVAALLALGLSAAVRRLGGKAQKALGLLTIVLWTLLHFGNYEHVKALGAPLQFTYAQYMKDGVFVIGSAFSISRLGWMVVLLALGVVGMLTSLRRGHRTLSWQTRAIAVLSLALLNATWPSDARALAWRENDFMQLVLTPSAAKASTSVGRAALPQRFLPNVMGDLNGTPFIAPHKGQPNVLLVILEGITGGSVPSVASAHGISQPADMPELSAFAERNISYSTFFANQRQTNRGEFALLCGHLDYLVSGTSRMTEYARDGGDPCLPRVLAERGYRTTYLQSAPLSFMMKDQFMSKAGFSDVRGHDAYPQAYARSNWGVDDRAFFEQSANMIRELDAGASPWFATLLTVGTHHPYTIPGDFSTGSAADENPHGKAVRYLDRALAAFVQDLEAQHILDDTLLLITSDESFGVEGYDDLTQLLSYNWGFLVAKVPGEGSRTVATPHAQTDVALSVMDYLGIGAGPFSGQSLFRDYDGERSIVFGNTYQKRVYWATPPQVVECDEGLTACQKHVSNGPGVFAPERSTTPAEDADIAPLRDMLALTATHRSHVSGRSPLILDNAAVWDMGPDNQGLVFGGQYLSLDADQEVVVSLDASLAGTGAAYMLDSDLFARGMLYEMYPPSLHDGDRLAFEYVYAPGKAVDNVEVRLNARRLNTNAGRLILKKADLVVRPRTLEQPGGVTTNFQISRARPQQTFYLGSGTATPGSRPMLATNPCVIERDRREFVTNGCRHSMLVFGPYVHVEPGSELRATFDVQTEKGTAALRAQLVSGMGREIYAESNVREVPAESGSSIVVTARVDAPVDGLEARLALLNGEADASLVIRRAVLEIFPPR